MLGVESELQLLAYTTATATWDPSHIRAIACSRQCRISDPMNEAKNQTHILMDTSRIHLYCAMTGTPGAAIFQLCDLR